MRETACSENRRDTPKDVTLCTEACKLVLIFLYVANVKPGVLCMRVKLSLLGTM